jgi:glycosyltransferase involved in cell wall biosynthesis
VVEVTSSFTALTRNRLRAGAPALPGDVVVEPASAGEGPGRQLCAINGRFLAAPQTGVQRVAREIAGALATLKRRDDRVVEGLDFELWVPPGLRAAAEEIGLPVREVGRGGGNLWEQLSLPRERPDALLLNLCNMGPLLRKQSVTMIHDAQVFQSPLSYPLAFRLWYRLAQRRLARHHRAILTVSQFSAGELSRLGVTAVPPHVVHNGADHLLRVPAAERLPSVPGLTRNGYVVGLSSTLAHKNIGLLLRAFADPNLASLQLVLYGSADATAFQAAGLNVPANVRFAGRLDDGELRALFEGALCIAFPSRVEGFGLPPLEAMQLGCPAVVTRCGALEEVCGSRALYAGADDPGDWVRAIRLLADDPDLRGRAGETGRDHARRFTWERAAFEIARILRDLSGRVDRPISRREQSL